MIIMDAANSVSLEKELLQKLIDQRVEGIILQPSSRQSSNYEFIAEHNIPLLLVDRQTEPERWSSVITNNISATKEVLEKALEKGYEQVFVVSEPVKDVSTREDRYRTVQETVLHSQKECHLIEVNDEDELTEKIEEVLKLPNKKLLFASNGRVLMECLTILIHKNISIPEEIGITGFDDWNLTELVGPGITSVEQPSRKIGKRAATHLLELITGKQQVSEIIVPSAIRWRKSV